MLAIRDAERALHQRIALACAAATAAGVGGEFRVWEQDGLFAASASDPALAFLSTVSGVRPDAVPAAIEFLSAAAWTGAPPTLLLPPDLDALPAMGLLRAADRALAITGLADPPAAAARLTVVEDGADERFLPILLAGYGMGGVVAEFIRAEHGSADIRRFLALRDGTPIAAAAMTIHGQIAVLGGAATLPAERGHGAQSTLLAHLLRAAADAGCVWAVATAQPHSVSSANLYRAGFRIYRRPAWTRR